MSNLYYIPEQGKLAKWLVERSSGMGKAFFCNSGAEGNEAAFKLARKYWWLKKQKQNSGGNGKGVGKDDSGGLPVIISAYNSFHGRTLATITATGQEKYHQNFGPMVEGFEYVCYNDAEDLKRVVDKVGKENLAGIIMEALQGEGGVVPGDLEFFKTVRGVCDEADALMICDEVQVGMGRTGKLWGFENLGVEPDVITTAKGLGGGVPIGLMMCKEKCNVFGPGDHASTFGGNPLASAAGFAVCNELEEGGVMKNCEARGTQIRDGLKEIAGKVEGVIKEVRGWGLINGIILKDDKQVNSSNVVQAAIDQGLLLVPAGPKVVRFVPPLIITEQQVKEALAKFEKAVQGVADSLKSQ